MIDIHTHSAFSPDGSDDCEKMVQSAKEKGLSVYGISDHFDLEVPLYLQPWSVPDIKEYSKRMLDLKASNKDIKFLFGAEFGYFDKEEYQKILKDLVDNYPFDYIINSVHFLDNYDIIDTGYFENKTQEFAYREALKQIIKSVDAPYYYSTIGHFEYFTRRAPFEDKALKLENFHDEITTLFKKVIDKKVALEINAKNVVYANNIFTKTSLELFKYYYDLGGRMITFGSDAHRCDEIARLYDYIAKNLKDLGFKEMTYFENRQPKFVKL